MNHNVSTTPGTNEQIDQLNNEAMSWQWVNECKVLEKKHDEPWNPDSMIWDDMKWYKPKWHQTKGHEMKGNDGKKGANTCLNETKWHETKLMT